jgi:hypothetical protein
MSKHSAKRINESLNRKIKTTNNPDKTDPYEVIRKFCEFGSLYENKMMFRKFCEAAIADKYCWKDGPPGKLLYFYELLEALIEACFVIYREKRFAKKILKWIVAKEEENHGAPFMPHSLSFEEYTNPLIVIKEFFNNNSLKEWKQSIHYWLEAGLSNFSVVESIEFDEILPFCYGIEKFVDACYRLA